ncbi:MAG TPA: NAD(P)H-binding protein, partial [Chloroflexota bacterium]
QLDAALADVDVVIHAASRPFTNGHAVDVLGTERLIQQARTAGVQHLIYPSIVGIDRIPFAYYRQKLAAEERIEVGGIPWSILRATQFHSLIDRTLRSAAWSPIILLPTDFQFQPVDPVEVATRLVQSIASGPQGRLPELAGPEVLRLGDLAQVWLEVRQLRRWVVRLPLPGRVAASFRRGDNTSLRAERGKVTWKQWLGRHWLPHSRRLDSPSL